MMGANRWMNSTTPRKSGTATAHFGLTADRPTPILHRFDLDALPLVLEARLREFRSIVGQLPRPFWTANAMEIFERIGWYGFFTVSSLYLTYEVVDGGLGLGVTHA